MPGFSNLDREIEKVDREFARVAEDLNERVKKLGMNGPPPEGPRPSAPPAPPPVHPTRPSTTIRREGEVVIPIAPVARQNPGLLKRIWRYLFPARDPRSIGDQFFDQIRADRAQAQADRILTAQAVNNYMHHRREQTAQQQQEEYRNLDQWVRLKENEPAPDARAKRSINL